MPSKETKNVVNGTNSTRALATKGSLAFFKNLYQGPQDNNEEWTWLSKEPEDVNDAVENEETAQHALITRLQKTNDSRKKFETHPIIIQSPWLKDALADILHDYSGIRCGLKRLEFEAPFKPFVHRWPQLLEYMARKDLDATTAEHIELLYDVLQVELKDVVKTLEDSVNHGIVTFDHIWTIYQPGSVIYSDSHNGSHGAYKLVSGAYVKTPCGKFYQLVFEAIEWNGTAFGRSVDISRLPEFLGTTRILRLSAFPLSLHPYEEKKWNAVLLLDECDFFLEARTTHDLERNKFVCIFLRVLEYYEGLLFLTTNRVDNIDKAFQSRNHVSLAYAKLTPQSKKGIWENFLRGVERWGEGDCEELGAVELNGRQIKNVIKSAALLAARKKEALSRRYVDMVLGIEKRRPGVTVDF